MIWQLNGFNLIRAKRKTSQEIYENFSSRQKSRKPFLRKIRWNVVNLVKTYHGIIVLLHFICPRRMVLWQERYEEERKERLLLQSGLDEKWSADSMDSYCYLRKVQDLLSDGKTTYERRFGESFNGPIIPCGAVVEFHPISAKDLARLHQFGKKAWNILRICLVCGRNLERRHFGRRH